MNLANYIACGYVITRPVGRISWGPELLPEQILSISSELCPRVPDYLAMPWANMDPEERYRESTTARQLGLSREAFQQVGARVMLLWKTGGLKWIDVFAAPEIARHFITETLASHRDRLLILGVGLHRGLVDEFLAESQSPPGSVHSVTGRDVTSPGEGGYAVYDMVANRGALAAGGTVLGFEPAGYAYGDFTSWLIHGLHVECHARFGIRPNRWGLLETAEQAAQCADHVRGVEGKEPGWWQSWLVVQYPTA
jgi:hypothetical protein